MNSMYLKIFMAIVFLQSNIVLGADVNLNNSNAQTQSNLQKDEVCVQAERPHDLEQQQHWYDYAYQQCQARNARRANVRTYTDRGARDAQEILSGNLKAPENKCVNNATANNNGYDYEYQSCMQNYNAQMQEYNRKKQAEQMAKQVESEAAVSAQTAEQQSLAKLNDKSATGSMAEVQQKNESGMNIYKAAGVGLAITAAINATTGTGCAATCTAMGTGCCSLAPYYFAGAAAFMLLNGKANKQASEHGQSALQSCQTFNQLSSAQKDCSGIDTNVSTPLVTTMYDDTGKCKQPIVPGCTDLPGAGGKNPIKIPGSNCKGISCLAGGPTLNKDGSVSVKTPTGTKTYSDSDFKDKKSMMAAGMSAAAADSLMDDLYGKNSALAKAGLDAKNMGKDSDHKGIGSFSDMGSASGKNIVNINSGPDSNKKFGDKMGEVALAARGPTSEGLSRDFNGDTIGAAGDDIFSMMKRRYNLKNEQDSFIAP
jgi:hypothetical protein